MQEFMNIALGFPTVIWTGLLAVVTAYWLFVIVGALDLDVLDVHLHIDPEFDIDLDLDVDADVDGAEIEGGASAIAKVAVALGLGKVPITILLTFFTFSGWTLSYFGMLYLAPMLKLGAIGAIMLGMTFVLAAPLMGALAHPLKGVFEMKTRRGGSDLIGQLCEITTGSVGESFGQAKYDDGGAGLLLSVRCETEDNNLGRKANALIIGYDRDKDVYFVEPYAQFMPSGGGEEMVMEVDAYETVDSEELVNAKREG